MDRLRNGEELRASSFVFGTCERNTSHPLNGTFCNKMFNSLAVALFTEEKARVLRSHSLRKGGATTGSACGLNESEVRLIGRWSLRILNFYVTTTTDQFIYFHKKMANWALERVQEPKFVKPLEIRFPVLFPQDFEYFNNSVGRGTPN